MTPPFGLLESVPVVVHNFRGRLDDRQWRAELMRDHRDKLTPQLPEFLLSGQGSKQFGLGLFPLRDVEAEDEQMRFAVDFDDVGQWGEVWTEPQRLRSWHSTSLSEP